MTIIQCNICRMPFQSLGSPTCTECSTKVDQEFIKVRDYIYDNPNSKMDKIVEETGVPKSTILHLLKEGRLSLDTPDTEGLLICEVCKEPITSGRMCYQCKKKVQADMLKTSSRSITPRAEKNGVVLPSNNAKMHTDITERRKQN